MTRAMADKPNRRGTHPNSRDNLRRGAQPPIRRPETKSPETLPAVTAAVDSAVQQVDASAAVQSLVPPAVVLLHRIISGSVRAPASVRAGVAMRVVELGVKPQQPPLQAPAGLGEALAALSRALELRQRAAVASDAEVVPAK